MQSINYVFVSTCLVLLLLSLGCAAPAAEIAPTAVAETELVTTETATVLPTVTSRPTETAVASPTVTLPPTETAVPEPTAAPPSLAYLGVVVDQATAEFTASGGLVSLYVQDLETGELLIRDPDIAFAGMSLVKIPILVETYRVLEQEPNVYYTKLITETASLSGNYTANLLLALVSGEDDPYNGTDVVTEAMRRLNLYNTFIAAPYDSIPREGRPTTFLTPANTRLDINTQPDPNMQTTVRDLGQLLSWVHGCALERPTPLDTYADGLTAADCAQILQVMTLNDIDSLLEEGVPSSVPIAHKHGWIGDTHGDAGIVFAPERPYVMVIILHRSGWLEWAESSPLIAELSRLAYRHFHEPNPYPADMVVLEPTAVPTTPTPDSPRAIVSGTDGIGLRLRMAPAGEEITILPEGSIVLLVNEAPRELNGVSWRLVRSVFGDEGWVGADFLLTETAGP